MKFRRLAKVALIGITLAAPGLGAQPRRAITFEDFASARMVSDPQLSPDGQWLLYAVRSTDLAANKRTTRTFMAPVNGGTARQYPDDKTIASEARWSPDGKSVAYTNAGQLWIAPAGGGAARQLTALTGGASGPVWSPKGDRVAFVTATYPDVPRRWVQRGEGEGEEREQGEGAHRRPAAVSPLECVRRRDAVAPVRGEARRQRPARLDSRCEVRCAPGTVRRQRGVLVQPRWQMAGVHRQGSGRGQRVVDGPEYLCGRGRRRDATRHDR